MNVPSHLLETEYERVEDPRPSEEKYWETGHEEDRATNGRVGQYHE